MEMMTYELIPLAEQHSKTFKGLAIVKELGHRRSLYSQGYHVCTVGLLDKEIHYLGGTWNKHTKWHLVAFINTFSKHKVNTVTLDRLRKDEE